jgi:hypothetical protein
MPHVALLSHFFCHAEEMCLTDSQRINYRQEVVENKPIMVACISFDYERAKWRHQLWQSPRKCYRNLPSFPPLKSC